MEGYFVRSLGLHRVYNSAFMHQLRDEDGAGMRSMIAGLLAFDPRILERFVNFLSNPDERPSVEQFGKGDKYFGACVLLATLPGTPLFGHGQFEGLTERYGMEYRRARYSEAPDSSFIERHERTIVPLLARRGLFASASAMRLYDFEDEGGAALENVFAFSNRRGEERALVIFNNQPAAVTGRLRHSAPATTSGSGRPARESSRTSSGSAGMAAASAAWTWFPGEGSSFRAKPSGGAGWSSPWSRTSTGCWSTSRSSEENARKQRLGRESEPAERPADSPSIDREGRTNQGRRYHLAARP